MIIRTQDAGATWIAQTSGTTNFLSSVAAAQDGRTAWAVGLNGTIMIGNSEYFTKIYAAKTNQEASEIAKSLG